MLHFNQPATDLNNSLSSHCQVNRVLWQVLGLNLLAAAVKLVVGLTTGSLSMLADGFHSTMRACSNGSALIGSTLANRPPDRGHPYGHQKYETFATLGAGLLLLLISWHVLESILGRLLDGRSPQVATASFVAALAAVGLNLLAAVYQKRRGGELRSRLLLAGAARLPFDLFVSVLVLASLVAASLGWARLDALAALLIVGEIGYTGWQMARCACQVLADRAVVDPAVVEAVALSVTGVRSCHKIRSRGPAWASHLDLHLQIDGCLPLEEAHRLGHLTRRRLEKRLKLKDVIVHLEPADSVE